jgi:hypothetical protein
LRFGNETRERTTGVRIPGDREVGENLDPGVRDPVKRPQEKTILQGAFVGVFSGIAEEQTRRLSPVQKEQRPRAVVFERHRGVALLLRQGPENMGWVDQPQRTAEVRPLREVHSGHQDECPVARDQSAHRILELTCPVDKFAERHRLERLALLETGDAGCGPVDHGHEAGVPGLEFEPAVLTPSGEEEAVNFDQGLIVE